MDKRTRMIGDIDLANCVGLEFGALASPMVPRSEGRILYVDYAATEVIRANIRDPAISPADVVEVDVVWGERRLREAVGEAVDYVIGSHVLEHVPDLIGWLLEVHEVLKPGGTLGLAIPDRSFTFDVLRNESTVGEIVEAYLLGYRGPSLRQIFDAATLSKNFCANEDNRQEKFKGGVPEDFFERLEGTYGWMKNLLREPAYVDAHCWIFTPESFLRTAEALATLELFPFIIESFFPTEPGSIEFQVRLTAASPDQTKEAKRGIERVRIANYSEDTLREFLCDVTPNRYGRAYQDLIGKISAFEAENSELKNRILELQRSKSGELTSPFLAFTRGFATKYRLGSLFRGKGKGVT